MRSHRHCLAAIAFAAVLAGCAAPPVLTTQRFRNEVQPPRASDAPVALLDAASTSCPGRKIGYITATAYDPADRAGLADRLRDGVRQLGGDAVVGFWQGEHRHGQDGNHPFAPLGNPSLESAWVGGSPGLAPDAPSPAMALVMSGTVVRYTGDCTPG